MAQMTGSFVSAHPRGAMRVGRARRRRPTLDRMVVTSLLVGVLAAVFVSTVIYLTTREAARALGVLAIGVGAIVLGAALGSAVWPLLGVKISRAILGIYARLGRSRNAQLLLTPYPDFVPSRGRQTWESTAFAGGLALALGVNALVIMSAPSGALPWLSLGMLALSCAMTFLLVPHWVFARLGLRLSQQGRFVVTSVSESYSRLVRVSNGTLLIGAIAYAVAVLLGRSARVDAYVTVAATLGVLLLLTVVVMTTATAFFRQHERLVCRRIAIEAKRVGFVGVTAGRVASI